MSDQDRQEVRCCDKCRGRDLVAGIEGFQFLLDWVREKDEITDLNDYEYMKEVLDDCQT